MGGFRTRVFLIEWCRVGAGSEHERIAINHSVKPALIESCLNVGLLGVHCSCAGRVQNESFFLDWKMLRRGGFNAWAFWRCLWIIVGAGSVYERIAINQSAKPAHDLQLTIHNPNLARRSCRRERRLLYRRERGLSRSVSWHLVWIYGRGQAPSLLLMLLSSARDWDTPVRNWHIMKIADSQIASSRKKLFVLKLRPIYYQKGAVPWFFSPNRNLRHYCYLLLKLNNIYKIKPITPYWREANESKKFCNCPCHYRRLARGLDVLHHPTSSSGWTDRIDHQ